jgi:type II secretory pathway pseudopilin PulG
MRPTRRNRKKKLQRKGAALLVVMFILMMATGTALFSLQSTQFEQRSAGTLQQAMRTRYVAEAATVGVLAYCYELGPAGCVDLKRAPDEDAGVRNKYALPNRGASEVVYQLDKTDLIGRSFPEGDGGVSGLIPTDKEISLGGTATVFTPSFLTVMEKWQVPNPGETRERFRLIVSTYGALGLSAGQTPGTGEFRGAHESISATRAHFDVR